MRYLPQMLLIGAAGRNAGKTACALAVLRRFLRRGPVVALKVTAVDQADGKCPRGGEGCGVCSSLRGPYLITEETRAGEEKDTERLLAGGATRVLWLRVHRAHLAEGLEALLKEAEDGVPLLCESNSLRRVVEPGLFLMMRRGEKAPMKDSAAAVREHVDRYVSLRGGELEATVGALSFGEDGWRMQEDLAAVVLAGGGSRRMGRDKRLLPVDGVPLATRVCEALRPHVARLLVSTSDGAPLPGVKADYVADEAPGEGPLRGLASALRASEHELNLVAACDIPNVTARAVRRLLHAAEGVDVAAARGDDGRPEPLFAVYRRSMLPRMESALARGERRVRAAFEGASVRLVDLPEANRPRNLNTPEEYEAYVKGHVEHASPGGGAGDTAGGGGGAAGGAGPPA